MKSIKKRLNLSKKTIANLDRIGMSDLKGGTLSTQACTDPSRTTGCIAQDCESHFWCLGTKNNCPTGTCPTTTN